VQRKELELDHMEDNHTEVVPGLRSREALLSIEGLERASGLPRALFVREVLDAERRVVASAHAEREGDSLPIEDAEALGEPVQVSIDDDGVCEALLHTAGEEPVLLRRLGGAFEVSVAAAPPARARELAESLAAEIRVKRRPRDMRVPLAFWSGGSGDGMFGGPEARWRRLTLPRFVEVDTNYPAAVRERLAELFSWSSGDSLPGRLALWHGAPGTGKTWALRALGREWSEWCDLHYITDPERLLGGDTAYMLKVLAGRSDPDLAGDEDEEGERAPGERWRLLVLEDAGELLGIAAPAEVGRGFARLLNIADGLLGQGSRALILVTTNEPLGKLHPAALRPGRAMATVEFSALEAAEASAWLAERGLERKLDAPATIAELHAIVAGSLSTAAAPEPVGFA
jgi:hypothetical protein